MRHRVPWWQPISGMFGSVIQNSLFLTGKHSIKYGYIVVPRKQCETGCHIVACWLQTMCRVSTCPTFMPSLCGAGEVAWLFHFKPRSIRQTHHSFGCYPPLWPPSGLHHPGPATSHSEVHHKGADLPTWTGIWKQCLTVYSLTALYSKAWCIRKLDAAADKPTLVTKQSSYFDTTMFPHCCSSYD